jgi:DNA primase small subunit
MNDGGWRSRLAKGVYEFLVMLSEEYLRQMGLKRGVIEFLLKEKSGLLEKWEKHSWQFIKEVGGVRSKTWKRILDVIIRSQAISIDVIVTTDIHRLIRLPNTLHGKTGLKAKVVSVSQLEGFDPLAECIVFSESDVCTIHIKSAPKFRVGQQTYGPYRDETVVLPHAAAIYLMLKAGAELV